MCISIEDLDQKLLNIKNEIILAFREEITTMKADIDLLKKQNNIIKEETIAGIQVRLQDTEKE